MDHPVLDISSTLYALWGLSVFRPLLHHPVMEAVGKLLKALCAAPDAPAAISAWGELSFRLQEAGASSLAGWLSEQVRWEETPFSRAVEAGTLEGQPFLEAAARRDVNALSALAALRPETLRLLFATGPELYHKAAASLPVWSPGEFPGYEELLAWYQDHGAGQFARYRAFLWERRTLEPVPRPDAPLPEELIGYRRQRGQVEENTRALLAGKRVNNILLFGDSGTGKSATVKSLLTMPGAQELRLIEVEKSGVASMPELMRQLAGRRQKFILFLDDLAFDKDDLNYSVLKTILEGGLEPRPDNVAIYATSNRRNLVRQTFSDRLGDEVDMNETIQEKTALADRFGLRIPYLSLTKGEYLDLVDVLCARAGLEIGREELHAGAARWDVRHPGRSPRTARQFIASLGV